MFLVPESCLMELALPSFPQAAPQLAGSLPLQLQVPSNPGHFRLALAPRTTQPTATQEQNALGGNTQPLGSKSTETLGSHLFLAHPQPKGLIQVFLPNESSAQPVRKSEERNFLHLHTNGNCHPLSPDVAVGLHDSLPARKPSTRASPPLPPPPANRPGAKALLQPRAPASQPWSSKTGVVGWGH